MNLPDRTALQATRVVVVGARCARQGIGEHVARSFAACGATVSAIVGTSARTLLAARAALRERHGIDCHGFVDLREALEVERPDVVALCSPYGTHESLLSAIAAAGAHCLCEKPLWWRAGLSAHTLRARTLELVAPFTARGLRLSTVTQWPCTLPTFYALHPALHGALPRRMSLEMGPTARGPAMVLDAAPHLLSLLEAIAGPAPVRNPRAVWRAGGEWLELDFEYACLPQPIEVAARYLTTPAPPRPAAYALDGHWARRVIRAPGYQQFFTDGTRELPLPDPLPILVREFLAALQGATHPTAEALAATLGNLRSLACSAQAAWDEAY